MTLQELIDDYKSDYTTAPQFRQYSQTLRKQLKTKQQVQSEFISNLQMLMIVTDDPIVEEKISAILKKFE